MDVIFLHYACVNNLNLSSNWYVLLKFPGNDFEMKEAYLFGGENRLLNYEKSSEGSQIVRLKSFEETMSTLRRLGLAGPRFNSAQQHFSRDQLWPCDGCTKVYRSKTSLNLHRRVECGKEPNQQCKFCFRTFYHISSLNRHVRVLHRDLLIKENHSSVISDAYNQNSSNIFKWIVFLMKKFMRISFLFNWVKLGPDFL